MLTAVFTSLAGMQAFKKGLDTISNNVANMNTPGFKLSDPLFRDLVQQAGGGVGSSMTTQPRGAGVQAETGELSFQQGDLRETGNSLDVAVDGDGFFVLDDGGQRFFTRAGQFKFNKDGLLVERQTGAKVMVSVDNSALQFFDLNTVRVFAPRATSEVTLSGRLARGGTTTSYELPQITVVDTSGAKSAFKARLNRDTNDPLHWMLEIVDSDDKVVGSGDIRFNANGTPMTDASALTVTITPTNGTPAFDVKFNFGAPGTFGGVKSVTGITTSELQVLKQDGLEFGSITKTEFTEQGEIQITYSNGEKITPAKLLLARFDATAQLKELGDGRFVVTDERSPIFGKALDNGMGRLVGGKIEMSNVDLTNQFTNLIIVQRGFQGSSQIASVANEMMQQLLTMSGNK